MTTDHRSELVAQNWNKLTAWAEKVQESCRGDGTTALGQDFLEADSHWMRMQHGFVILLSAIYFLSYSCDAPRTRTYFPAGNHFGAKSTLASRLGNTWKSVNFLFHRVDVSTSQNMYFGMLPVHHVSITWVKFSFCHCSALDALNQQLRTGEIPPFFVTFWVFPEKNCFDTCNVISVQFFLPLFSFILFIKQKTMTKKTYRDRRSALPLFASHTVCTSDWCTYTIPNDTCSGLFRFGLCLKSICQNIRYLPSYLKTLAFVVHKTCNKHAVWNTLKLVNAQSDGIGRSSQLLVDLNRKRENKKPYQVQPHPVKCICGLMQQIHQYTGGKICPNLFFFFLQYCLDQRVKICPTIPTPEAMK